MVHAHNLNRRPGGRGAECEPDSPRTTNPTQALARGISVTMVQRRDSGGSLHHHPLQPSTSPIARSSWTGLQPCRPSEQVFGVPQCPTRIWEHFRPLVSPHAPASHVACTVITCDVVSVGTRRKHKQLAHLRSSTERARQSFGSFVSPSNVKPIARLALASVRAATSSAASWPSLSTCVRYSVSVTIS